MPVCKGLNRTKSHRKCFAFHIVISNKSNKAEGFQQSLTAMFIFNSAKDEIEKKARKTWCLYHQI